MVLANAAVAFCGDDGPEAVATMHDPETLFETAPYAAWRTLRDDADAAWLGLCLTRVALRRGSLVVNSSQGGGSKDTWVMEDQAVC